MEWLLEFKQAEVAPGTSKAEAQRLSHYLLDNLLDFVQLSTTGQPTPSSPKGSPDNDASWKLRLAHRFECFHSAPDCREAQQELGNALARAPDSVGGPQSGLHAAAAVGLKPRPPTGSAPQPSGFRRLRSSRLLGAALPVPPPAVGPGAAVEVSQCVKEEWRLNDAPGGRPIEDAAARYIRALEDTVQRIESGTTANRVVKFIERLPRALREIVPGAEGWLRDDDVTTNEVWTTASERVSYKPGFWERRASGLLSMLHDLLQRIAEFVQWVNAERLWNAEHESIRELVYKAKANDKKKDKDEPLSDEAKADLVDRAQQDVKCLCALLRRWDTATALDMTVCAFLYCGNMSPLRFRERPFDRHGRPDDQYKGAPPGKSNSHCQVFYVWNKALRELADPSIGGPEGETPRGKKERMECNRKVVKLFEPMTHLLTELIHTLAAREPMVVSRGIDVRLSEKYVQGNTVAMPSFWSASRNPSKSYELVGPSTGTWFIFHTVRAASMQWCALFLSERECLFPPSITTKVILKFSDVLLWAVGTKKENMKDLVFLRDSLMPDWDLETLVKHSCEVLMQCGRLSVFGPFCKTYGRMRCTVFEGDGPSCGEDLEVFEVLKRFLSSKVVHVMVLTGAGDEITRALVALAHGACQPAAGWVPFFDGLGEIPRLLEQEGSYREHIKKVLLTCHDPDRAFEILLRQRVLHALDGLQDVVKPGAATWPTRTQLLRYVGLNASPLQKVCIGYDAAQVSARGGPRAKMSELHDGRVWRVHILGVDENGSREFAVRCSGGDRSSHESDSQGPGGPSGPGPPGGSDGGGSQSGGGPGAAPPGGAPHQLARTFSKLHKDHPALAKIPFVNEMVADLVLQSGDHARWARVEAHQSFLWELTSEWCLLHVQREIKQELELDQPAVVTAAAQVAVVFSVLLTLTGTRYCSLGPVAAVLADPTRVRDDPLRFSIKLSEKERKQLANHLEFLLGLGGVPKEWVRDLLCVLPLRSSNIEADGGLCSFQHKIVADWTLALWFSMALSCPADACPPAALVYHFASPCCQASFTLLAERAVSDARLAAQLGRALCLRHHAEQQHGGVHAHTDPFTPMRRVSARLLHQTAPRRIQSLIESAIAEGQRRALYPAATAHTKAEEGRHAKEQTERTRGQAAELAELRRGKEAAETEVILLRAEMAQLRAAHKQKQGEVHEANEQQRKVAQATSEAAQQRDECHSMLAELEELKRGREGAGREVQALRAEAGMLTESIERQRAEQARAEQQLEQMKAEAEQLAGAAQRQEAVREQIDEQLVKMKEEATQLTEFIKGQKAEKAQLEAQLDEQKVEAAQLDESIEGRNAELAQIDAQLAEMRTEAAQLAESIEGRNAEREQIDAQLAETQAEAAQLGDSQTERGAEGSAAPAVEAAMAERDLLSGQSAEMASPAAEPQLEYLQRQLQGSQMELEETRRELSELRETAQRDAEAAGNLQAAMGLRMQEQLEAHAAQLRAAEEKASSQLRAAEEKASSQLQEAAAAAADLQATADRLTSDCSDLQEERDRLRRELADITADRDARQREPAEGSKRIQELEGERQKLQKRLEEAEQRAQFAESEKESADTQVRQMQVVQSETEEKLQAALARAEAPEERGRQLPDAGEQPADAEGHPETAQCRRDLLSLQARLDRVRDPDDKQQRDESASDDSEDDDAAARTAGRRSRSPGRTIEQVRQRFASVLQELRSLPEQLDRIQGWDVSVDYSYGKPQWEVSLKGVALSPTAKKFLSHHFRCGFSVPGHFHICDAHEIPYGEDPSSADSNPITM